MEKCPWYNRYITSGDWECIQIPENMPEYLPEPIAVDDIELPEEGDPLEE
jgi:hypothetical protein